MPDETPIAPPATVEKTTETHETVTTKGDASALPASPPSMRLDDRVRAFIAITMVAQWTFLVTYSQITGKPIDNSVLTVDVSLVTGAIGFYLGSSYGSKNSKDPLK